MKFVGRETWRMLQGHALEQLRSLPEASVHCVVTSPPYFGLRKYPGADVTWPDGWEGHLGLEPTPNLYVQHLIVVFEEVRRVLRDDGTLWLNLGDSYANDGKWGGASGGKHVAALHGTTSVGRERRSTGLKPKNLIGIPWRVAFALQGTGWTLRSDVIWAKTNPMPESITDRPTSSHEHVFLLAKAERYFYDAFAIREPHTMKPQRRPNGRPTDETPRPGQPRQAWSTATRDDKGVDGDPAGRNKRDVWPISTKPYPEAHFAVMPMSLVEPCILAGTSEHGACAACGTPYTRIVERTPMEVPPSARRDGVRDASRGSSQRTAITGTMTKAPTSTSVGWTRECACGDAIVPCSVLDPFAGSGTVGLVARRCGRAFIGIDLNPEYAEMARRRIEDDAPLFNRTEVPKV